MLMKLLFLCLLPAVCSFSTCCCHWTLPFLPLCNSVVWDPWCWSWVLQQWVYTAWVWSGLFFCFFFLSPQKSMQACHTEWTITYSFHSELEFAAVDIHTPSPLTALTYFFYFWYGVPPHASLAFCDSSSWFVFPYLFTRRLDVVSLVLVLFWATSTLLVYVCQEEMEWK